ncbi:MAG: glycosyltransferase family 4 protein [Coriobacteriia bacterium]|nr:glycosyltransferase family 4 protein [Coriobacteriia bacterium]
MRSLKGIGILLVNNFAGPGMGGGEVHLLNLARACRDAGMLVHVVCQPGGELEAAARALGVTVAPYRLGRRNLLRTSSRIRKYVGRNGVQVVHSGGVLANVIVRLACRQLPVCVVTTVQVEPGAAAFDGGGRRGVWLRRLLERATRGRSDRFVTVSHAIARTLVADGVPESRVIVAHNGVRVGEVRSAAVGALPDAFAGAAPVVGCIARLELVKGVDVFIRAAAAATGSAARFVIVGDGSQREALEALASDLGVSGSVTFTGVLAPATPALAKLDVVVVPSRSEGLPMVVLEAMALERPVVASAVGGIPEAVDDGVTGLLVPPDDPEALAAAITRLLDDPAMRASMGAAGAARVVDHFSLEDQMRQYLGLFRSLVSEAAKRD